MLKRIFSLNLLAFIIITCYSQEIDFKEQALVEFKNENYSKAIDLLKQAEKQNPKDPEVYYYLGYFCHYLAYDSRPFKSYSLDWSDLVLEYLNKAISIDPNYGDAYYFLGAEYGGRARDALFEGDVKKCGSEYAKSRKLGGNPDWLIELGKNMLKSCEPNAILFTAGDADLNAIHYLQFVENYRRDVSVFPLARLGTPWYVKLMKEGIPDFIPSVPISWTDFQIYSMRNYRWDTNIVEIPICDKYNKLYNLSGNDTLMNILLEPDLSSDRRTYLSPGSALLIDIIETNKWERPIYFPVLSGKNETFVNYFQLCGLTYRLLPVETEKFGILINSEVIENVYLDKKNYSGLVSSFPENDMPRTSNLLNSYRWILCRLAEHYYKNDKVDKGNYVLEKMNECIPKEVVPLPEYYEKWIKKLKME